MLTSVVDRLQRLPRGVRSPLIWWPLIIAAVALLPWMGVGNSLLRQIMLAGILVFLVSGLNLSFGYIGELALSNVACYAAATYLTGYVAINHFNDLGVSLILSVGIALLLGIIIGVPGLRLGGWALAIVSFFVVLLIPDVLIIFKEQTGGTSGLAGIPLPELFGAPISTRVFYVLLVVVCGLWLILLRNVVKSPHGSAFLVIRHSPVLAQSLGMPTYATKIKVYALSAVPAGIAGGFFAYLDSFVFQTAFGFDVLVLVLAASVIGGSRSVLGAVVGAVLLQYVHFEFHSMGYFSLVIYGAVLIACAILMPAGVAGLFRSLARRPVDRAAAEAAIEGDGRRTIEVPPIDGKLLEASDVSISFGGVRALGGAGLTCRPGEVTALIGPNGSGKTTMLNVICGYYSPDSGTVRLGEESLTGLRPYQIARAGIARTFQTPSIPVGLSVREVVASARYSANRLSVTSAMFRLPRARRVMRSDERECTRILESLGLGHIAERTADALPLGTRRMVELARAVAAGAAVLLLDEAASGLDENELAELSSLICGIRDAGATVVLVEHNFALVQALADRVVVLAEGKMLAEGTPAQIAADPHVQRRYLGEIPPDQELPSEQAIDSSSERAEALGRSSGSSA